MGIHSGFGKGCKKTDKAMIGLIIYSIGVFTTIFYGIWMFRGIRHMNGMLKNKNFWAGVILNIMLMCIISWFGLLILFSIDREIKKENK